MRIVSGVFNSLPTGRFKHFLGGVKGRRDSKRKQNTKSVLTPQEVLMYKSRGIGTKLELNNRHYKPTLNIDTLTTTTIAVINLTLSLTLTP